MTLGDAQKRIEDKLKALGFKQWETPFSFNNIPNNIVDQAFHITVGQIQADSAKHLVHVFKMPVTVRFFFKGYKTPLAALKIALAQMDDVYTAVLSPSFRLNDGFKNIIPISALPQPIATSAENSLIIEMVFECVFNFSFKGE